MYHALEYLKKTRAEYRRHAFLSGVLVSIFVFASAGRPSSWYWFFLRIRASKLTQSQDLFGIRDEMYVYSTVQR